MRKWLALFLLSALPAQAQFFATPPYPIVNSPIIDTTATVKVNGNFAQVVSDGNTGASSLLSQIAALGPVGLPIGAVVYLNAQTCPPGWQPADGTGVTADARGLHIRGLDASGTVDVGPPSPRTLASFERTMIQDHTHAPSSAIGSLGFQIGATAGATFAMINSFTQYTTNTGFVISPAGGAGENIPASIVYLTCERIS